MHSKLKILSRKNSKAEILLFWKLSAQFNHQRITASQSLSSKMNVIAPCSDALVATTMKNTEMPHI
jgi:hypothetical protein